MRVMGVIRKIKKLFVSRTVGLISMNKKIYYGTGEENVKLKL